MSWLHRIRGLAGDRYGAAAVELALVAPILAMVVAVSYSVWQQAATRQNLREALNAGAEYYMNGGVDDAYAKTLVLSVWQDKPDDGAVSTARDCACGAVAWSCSSLCSGSTQTSVYVTLTAQAQQTVLQQQTLITEARKVRVR